jgi:hypothetical protein
LVTLRSRTSCKFEKGSLRESFFSFFGGIDKGLALKNGEKRLTLDVSFQGNTLTSIIEDNGVGFKESQRIKEKMKDYKSYGQSILIERIKIHN